MAFSRKMKLLTEDGYKYAHAMHDGKHRVAGNAWPKEGSDNRIPQIHGTEGRLIPVGLRTVVRIDIAEGDDFLLVTPDQEMWSRMRSDTWEWVPARELADGACLARLTHEPGGVPLRRQQDRDEVKAAVERYKFRSTRQEKVKDDKGNDIEVSVDDGEKPFGENHMVRVKGGPVSYGEDDCYEYEGPLPGVYVEGFLLKTAAG